jgi:uncharacterized membrane protein
MMTRPDRSQLVQAVAEAALQPDGMAPLIALTTSFALFAALGLAGVPSLAGWLTPLRLALSVMFLLTASAHRGKRRPDLVRMVPPAFPRPDLLVTATGLLELAGAAGLLLRSTASYAAAGLSLLLLAMFPANVHAARAGLTIGGRPVPALAPRTALQLLFLAATLAVVFGVR